MFQYEQATTICPRSIVLYVTYYIKWVTTSWTYSNTMNADLLQTDLVILSNFRSVDIFFKQTRLMTQAVQYLKT